MNYHQIARMAEAGLNNYEVSCDWDLAIREIREYGEDFYGFTPTIQQQMLALKLSKMGWSERVIPIKKKVVKYN
jgi:hypothetical protein